MYAQQITAPINTPQSSPVTVVIPAVISTVQTVHIRFPDGCAGLVGVRLTDRGSQFAPLYGWIEGNATEINLTVNRKLQGPPREIIVQVYNEDDTFPHTVEVRIT